VNDAGQTLASDECHTDRASGLRSGGHRGRERKVLFNPEAVRGRYLEDLLDQPRALQATLTSLCDSPIFDALERSCGRGRLERVVLTGMGSSFFGLHPLSIELAANGWTPLMVETSELIHYYPNLLTPSTLVVAVSQSGKSVETVRLLEMNARRATIVGVTNHADSPLGQQADFAVVCAAGEEYSVSCKTYVCGLAALQMVAASLCGLDREQRWRALEAAPAAVDGYLRNWAAHAGEFTEMLRDARDLFLVGRGESLAAAQTGALIIKESDHFHAEGMSSAAFRHGPLEMIKRRVFVGVFAGDGKAQPLSEGLMRDLAITSARAVLIGGDAGPGACRLPEVAEILRPVLMPILEILPAQMITLALAAIAKREPGKFERATKVTATE
jgi:glucosamine--fructose-6-phosphate aminotransferase (isomerizing)